jgi:hypothetical protein
MLLLKRTFWVLSLAAGGALFFSVGKDLAGKEPGLGMHIFGGLIFLGGIAFCLAALWLFCSYCFGKFLRSSPVFQAVARRVQLTPVQRLSLEYCIASARSGGHTNAV